MTVSNQKPVAADVNSSDQEEPLRDNEIKSDDGAGNVTLTAQYLVDQFDQDMLVFEVSLNTHSVDLDEIDFGRDVYLEKDGQKIDPLSFEASGVGHHRSAVLSFPRVEPPFKLVGVNIGGVAKRELTWNAL